MDPQRFDPIAKLSESRLSRRAALRAGAAGLAASALAVTGRGRTREVQVEAAATPVPPVATPQGSPVPSPTGVAPLPLTGQRLAAFDAYATAKFADLRVPGAAIAVVQGGQTLYLQGFGVRELGRAAPVTGDTLLRIGSVTKSFSSLLTATLVDAGSVRWDTPLVDLLPSFAVANPALTPRLTISDAFSAATGLPRRDLELFFNATSLTPEKLIASIRQLPLTAPYGTTYQYSNQMVAAGGFAAAVAAGGAPTDLDPAYAIALRAQVLNPIGMTRTTLALTDVLADGDYATPHAEDLTGALHPLPLLEDDLWIVPVAPAGALWSSAGEMARYLQMQLGHGLIPGGDRVVSAANLARTWQPGIALPAQPGVPPALASSAGHYGLGWGVGTYAGQRLISHSGGTFGFAAELAFLPDADLGVVILTTGSGASALFTLAVQFRLLELVFDQLAIIDTFLTQTLAATAKGRADLLAQLGQAEPLAVTPYLGRYANPALGELTLRWEHGQLLFADGAIHSALRPQVDATGKVTTYLLTDPPLGGFPPTQTLTLHEGSDGRPQVVLTAKADPGEPDLVYVFAPVGVAIPTP